MMNALNRAAKLVSFVPQSLKWHNYSHTYHYCSLPLLPLPSFILYLLKCTQMNNTPLNGAQGSQSASIKLGARFLSLRRVIPQRTQYTALRLSCLYTSAMSRQGQSAVRYGRAKLTNQIKRLPIGMHES
jgi:hypothetical protein